ncbi:TPA: hypothetical protein NEG48_002903 [Elizabethkingia anophelis]|nr:hypothetical protein [Elizabethkingia anophelis]
MDFLDHLKVILLAIVTSILAAIIITAIRYKISDNKKYYEITFSDKSVIRDSMIETTDSFQYGNISYYKTNIISSIEITNNEK